jgi:hypothetical protein
VHISSGKLVAEATFTNGNGGISARLPWRSEAGTGLAITPKQNLRLKLYAALVAIDCLCLVAAYLLADLIRFGNPLDAAGLNLLAVLLPVFVVTGFNLDAYGMDVLRKPRVGIFRAVIALAAAVGLVLLAAFFLKASADFSRMVLAIGTFGGVALIGGSRFTFGKYALRLLNHNPLSEIVIVDGVEFARDNGVRCIEAAGAGLAPNPYDPLMLHRLGTLLEGADRVVIACPPERRALWALLLKGANVQGEVLAPNWKK